MRFSAITLLACAAAAAAQTTKAAPGGAEVCEAQNIVDACVFGYDQQLKNCPSTDYICQCDLYTNKLTCYNNCPDSAEKAPVANQVLQFCNAAAPLRSESAASRSAHEATMTNKPAATTTGSTETEETGASRALTGFGSGTATGPGGAANTGAAAALVVPAGGALAALLVGLL